MCYFPILITKPNKYRDSGSDEKIWVPCSKCNACYNKRADQWLIRLHYQLKDSVSAHFVTLTYEDSPRSYNGWNTCIKSDLQNYFKRLRKHEHGNQNIKYYAASEYGEKNHRPHYHAIVFNTLNEDNIRRAWQLDRQSIGNVVVGTVTNESIRYVTGYIGKRIGIPWSDDDDRLREFSLMSKNLGNYYVQKASQFHLNTSCGYTQLGKIKYTLPRYYKNKIFGEASKQLADISHQNYQLYAKKIQTQIASLTDLDAIQDCGANINQIKKRNNSRSSTFTNIKF